VTTVVPFMLRLVAGSVTEPPPVRATFTPTTAPARLVRTLETVPMLVPAELLTVSPVVRPVSVVTPALDRALFGLIAGKQLKPPHGVKPVPEKSFFYARYRLRGDRIDLFQVDSDKTAALVLDGKVGGTVDKSQNELHVYVTGSRAQMLDLVKAHDIFDEKKPVRLVRSKETLEQFEKSVMSDGAQR